MFVALGCSDPCDFESPCPERFDVARWCAEHDARCMVGTAPAACSGRQCELRKGETMTVPLAEIGNELAERPQIFVGSLLSEDEVAAWDLRGTLDGVAARVIRLPANRASLSFVPMPANPMVFTLTYQVGSADVAMIDVLFHDYVCEQLHPAPPCRG